MNFPPKRQRRGMFIALRLLNTPSSSGATRSRQIHAKFTVPKYAKPRLKRHIPVPSQRHPAVIYGIGAAPNWLIELTINSNLIFISKLTRKNNPEQA
jgi:hypothetical protein